MNATELVNGKGQRVEIQTRNGIEVGTLMGQKRCNYAKLFYVRLDGSERRSLVNAREIIRFI